MERRRAIAVASSTSIAALAGIVALAANSGSGLLGFGGDGAVEPAPTTTPSTWVDATVPAPVPPSAPVDPVVVTEVVYDDEYVVVPAAAPATPAASPELPAGEQPSAGPTTSTTSPPAATASSPTVPGSDPPPTTSATEPGGGDAVPPGFEVPEDWPEGEPYPPIPDGCERGHLEDDGSWNCEH